MEAADSNLPIPALAHWGSNTLAVLLLVSSILGLTFGAEGFYASDPKTLPQFLGQDLITLILGIPLLLGSMRLGQQGSLKGKLLWAGLLLYFAYSYSFYVAGVPLNGLFLAYIAIVGLSLYSFFALWMVLQAVDVRPQFSHPMPTRFLAVFLLVTASLFSALWIGLSLSRLLTGGELTALERQVIAIDGILLLPLVALAGGLLWRRHPWGYLLTGILLTMLSLLGFTLVVNTGMVAIWRQPVDWLQSVLLTAMLMGALVGLVGYLESITTTVSGKL